MSTTANQRDRLAELRKTLSEQRRELHRARHDRDQDREAFAAADHDGDVVSSPAFRRAEASVARVNRIENEIALFEAEERDVLQGLGGSSGISSTGFGAGLTFASNPEVQETARRIASSDQPLPNKIALGEFMDVQAVTHLTGRMLAAAPGTVVPADEPRRGGFMGIVAPPQAPLALLDFFATVPFEGRLASFMRRSGGIANAGVQVEGGIKAAAEIIYTPVDVEAETVASYTKARRQDLDDVEGLMADMQDTLSYGVMHKVEALLVAEIIGTSGIGAPDTSGDTTAPDKLLTALGLLLAAGVQPNFIGLHPTDLTAMRKLRETVDGAYLMGSPFASMPPLIPSSALTAGQALVGDSRIGAKLGVRQGITALVGTESEDLIRNILTVVLEGRWAPMVIVPSALSLVDLT